MPVKSTNGRRTCLNLKKIKASQEYGKNMQFRKIKGITVDLSELRITAVDVHHLNLSLCVHYYLPIYPPPPKDTQSPGSQLLVISCWRYAGVIPLTEISTGRQDLTFKRRK